MRKNKPLTFSQESYAAMVSDITNYVSFVLAGGKSIKGPFQMSGQDKTNGGGGTASGGIFFLVLLY